MQLALKAFLVRGNRNQLRDGVILTTTIESSALSTQKMRKTPSTLCFSILQPQVAMLNVPSAQILFADLIWPIVRALLGHWHGVSD